MAKDYNAIHYIQNQVKKYNFDDKLSDLLIRGFNLIYNNQEADGCASNTTALYVCLTNMGYNPQICYGLCIAGNGFCFYHMWLELDEKIIDLAIYGNARFNFLSDELADIIKIPIVLEAYDEANIRYRKFVFDDDWKYAGISAIENMSLKEYINNAPNNGMKKLICRYMDVSPTMGNINKLLDNVSDFHFADLKKGNG